MEEKESNGEERVGLDEEKIDRTVQFSLIGGKAGNFLQLLWTQRTEIWGWRGFHLPRWESAAFRNLG